MQSADKHTAVLWMIVQMSKVGCELCILGEEVWSIELHGISAGIPNSMYSPAHVVINSNYLPFNLLESNEYIQFDFIVEVTGISLL